MFGLTQPMQIYMFWPVTEPGQPPTFCHLQSLWFFSTFNINNYVVQGVSVGYWSHSLWKGRRGIEQMTRDQGPIPCCGVCIGIGILIENVGGYNSDGT